MSLEAKHGFSLRPMQVGAEVVGLAPGAEANPDVRRALNDAWMEYGLLLFRNIESDEHHVALSQCFGELELPLIAETRLDSNPYLTELGGDTRSVAYVYDDDIRVMRIPWHRDFGFTRDISRGSMLRLLVVPPHDGETLIADLAKAYDDLPTRMKKRLEALEYKATLRSDPLTQTRPGNYWTAVRMATADEDPEFAIRKPIVNTNKFPSVVHPAVLKHPDSGRMCILINPRDVDYFLGMEPAESEQLLQDLVGHMLAPKYVYRHRWTVNDALLWDNRRCVHSATGSKPNERRYGRRTSLAGPIRTGRYFDSNARPPSIAGVMD